MSAARAYEIKITGRTPMIFHWDNIEWSDQMDAWKDDPANKLGSRAGDDRSPAWRWIGSCYHDGKHIAMPTENLMRALMEGGAMVPVPGGKNGKTFKSQTQSGMSPVETEWPVLINGKKVPYEPIAKLISETDFKVHKEVASELGFELYVKRAKVGTSKHIRVRPRFQSWAISGIINVWDDQITDSVLSDVLLYGGRYKGLGDWRPGGKTPGPYGTFTAEVKRV